MARLDISLIRKLAGKLKKPEQYIKEQISKKASRNNVSSEACLVKWLKDENIGCLVYFNGLIPEIKQQIRSLNESKKVEVVAPRSGRHVIKVDKSYKVHNSTVAPTSKLISLASINLAVNNANLYPELFLFENSLRIFINLVLTKKYGAKWWDNRVNGNTQGTIAGRMKKEKMNPWHGARGLDPLSYTDLSDLTNIIRSHPNEFGPFFKDVTGKLNWLVQRLEEIYLTRNNLAHSTPLKQGDINRFRAYFIDWYKQIPLIEANL